MSRPRLLVSARRGSGGRADGDRDLGAATAAGSVSHLNGDVVLSRGAEGHLWIRGGRALRGTAEIPAVGQRAAVLAGDRRTEGDRSADRHSRLRCRHGDGEQWTFEYLDRDRQRLIVVGRLHLVEEIVIRLTLTAPAPRPVVLIHRTESLNDRSFLGTVEVGRALRDEVRGREHRTRSRLGSSLAVDHRNSADSRDRNRSRQAAKNCRQGPRSAGGKLHVDEPVSAELVHVGAGVRGAFRVRLELCQRDRVVLRGPTGRVHGRGHDLVRARICRGDRRLPSERDQRAREHQREPPPRDDPGAAVGRPPTFVRADAPRHGPSVWRPSSNPRSSEPLPAGRTRVAAPTSRA